MGGGARRAGLSLALLAPAYLGTRRSGLKALQTMPGCAGGSGGNFALDAVGTPAGRRANRSGPAGGHATAEGVVTVAVVAGGAPVDAIAGSPAWRHALRETG